MEIVSDKRKHDFHRLKSVKYDFAPFFVCRDCFVCDKARKSIGFQCIRKLLDLHFVIVTVTNPMGVPPALPGRQ